jgi:hypothetical protein
LEEGRIEEEEEEKKKKKKEKRKKVKQLNIAEKCAFCRGATWRLGSQSGLDTWPARALFLGTFRPFFFPFVFEN